MENINPDDVILKKKSIQAEQEDLPEWMKTVNDVEMLGRSDAESDEWLKDVEFKEKSLLDVYNDLPVKPFIKSVDLNNSEEEPNVNRPRTSLEIGITFDF